jgi:hypothetical protein
MARLLPQAKEKTCIEDIIREVYKQKGISAKEIGREKKEK